MEVVTEGGRLSGPADSRGLEWRWLAISVGVAAWCTAWTWGLLAITRSFPGIVSGREGMGALELLEIPTGRPYPLVLLAIFLLCLLPPLLLGLLRDVLDRDRKAVAALSWPLRSRGFVLACVAWTIAGGCWVFLLDENSPLQLIGFVAMVAAWAMTPFLSWNPATLGDEAPTHWYRPSWPGWPALVVCLALWLASLLSDFVFDVLATALGNAWWTWLFWLFGDAFAACILIAAIIAWLNRGNWQSACADGARLARSRFVGEYIWQSAAALVLVAAIAMPALVVAMEAIFVFPQYVQWAEAADEPLRWWFRLLAGASRKGFALLLVASVPVGLYLNLACARLVRRHGVGRLA